MAEIKSTLDLVMSRTRHLTMSEAEKNRQRRQEGTKRLGGLVQQYADGALSTHRLAQGLRALENEFGIDGPKDLARAVVQRCDPDQDNTRWLEMLREVAAVDTTGVQEAAAQYREARDKLDRRHTQAALARLAATGISGSAVAPRLEAEPDWQTEVDRLRRDFYRHIGASKTEPSAD